MTADGDRPGGAPRPQPKPNDAPPRDSFASLPAAERLRVVEILRPGWNKALAKYADRKRAEAEHARAA